MPSRLHHTEDEKRLTFQPNVREIYKRYQDSLFLAFVLVAIALAVGVLAYLDALCRAVPCAAGMAQRHRSNVHHSVASSLTWVVLPMFSMG